MTDLKPGDLIRLVDDLYDPRYVFLYVNCGDNPAKLGEGDGGFSNDPKKAAHLVHGAQAMVVYVVDPDAHLNKMLVLAEGHFGWTWARTWKKL